MKSFREEEQVRLDEKLRRITKAPPKKEKPAD